MELATRQYRAVHYISGPLVFTRSIPEAVYGAMVRILLPTGEERTGQVLETSEENVVIQVLEATAGLDVDSTRVVFRDEVAKIGVSLDMLGRVFNGAGKPVDGLPQVLPEKRLEITGSPINPISRERPAEFIQTGISAIDGLNTLVRGQKLPIFSGAGLPANDIASQLVRQAKVRGEAEHFAVVFAAMGITQREASFFMRDFEKTGALGRTVIFLNLADEPTIERLLTPRCALTVAEYLAFECDMHVLVILTDMTNYCEALREIGSAREEVPGRRGYPGYMYTDLATIYERAGRIKGKKGSITQIPILTMPDDDITHPIADLTGYITEGQIVLSRELHRKGIYPPIDALPCLSRLMNQGIGEGQTREDHRGFADQLYAYYAKGRELRRLVAIVGEEALTELDQSYLKLAEDFERSFIHQGSEDRSMERTFDIGWGLLSQLPRAELRRIKTEHIDRYYQEERKPVQAVI
ncbi:MAG: V-type ATP synthase subunit B [Deltaproteobacteria bacterium]|nr:V-type ATP synthase subunit B [Deltaproteobacteria bacterium]MBW2123277.1 V-type ATP synthase subunit B [Deltaproteobacteria bacterium]